MPRDWDITRYSFQSPSMRIDINVSDIYRPFSNIPSMPLMFSIKRGWMIMKFVPFLFNGGKGETLTVNGSCVCVGERALTGLENRRCIEVWRIAINHRLFCRGRFNALSQTLKCRYDVEFCAKYREKEDITTLNCSALPASRLVHTHTRNRIIKRRTQ